MSGRQLDNVVKLFSSFGTTEITLRHCEKDYVPLSNPAFNGSKSATPMRSKKASENSFVKPSLPGVLVFCKTVQSMKTFMFYKVGEVQNSLAKLWNFLDTCFLLQGQNSF